MSPTCSHPFNRQNLGLVLGGIRVSALSMEAAAFTKFKKGFQNR
jgi:hypothetical protein